VVDPVSLDRVAKRAHHVLLTDDLIEGLGAVAAVERRLAGHNTWIALRPTQSLFFRGSALTVASLAAASGPSPGAFAVCDTVALVGSSENFLDHGRRIAALERKVDDLYTRLGQAQPEFGMQFDSETPASVEAADDPRLIELIQAGKTINAIKLYRELTGTGLAEAKDAVERIEQMYRPTAGG
jgi:hypothetical protein